MATSAARAPDERSLAALEQLLAREDSATSALAQWCAAQGIAADPVIRARRVAGGAAAAPEDLRGRLSVAADEPLGFRHVELVCGSRVLSVARNWYVPARLPEAMRRELSEGTRPFGAVIAPLGFHRERIGSERGAGARGGCPAATILANRALIVLPSGKPLALVVECYQPGVL